MKLNKTTILALLLLAVALATPVVAVKQHTNYRAILRGSNQNPSVETNAHGVFIATVSPDGKSITFKLIVANMENVTMAHIHIGDSATNGPVVVFLFHTETPVARQDGVLSQGTFTASDFKGPLMGQAFSALINAIMNGDAYVNVHSTQHPAGEIRGQIFIAGKTN